MISIPVEAARTPVSTTIPPTPTTPPGVQYQCQPFESFPGSAVAGTSGFILVKCPTSGALLLGPGFITPTVSLPSGFDNISITLPNSGGQPCDFNFGGTIIGTVTVQSGHYLNKGMDFENPPTNSTQMLATVYDYCIHYTNAPASGVGIAGFSVSWG